jgi:hypothetical protein
MMIAWYMEYRSICHATYGFMDLNAFDWQIDFSGEGS